MCEGFQRKTHLAGMIYKQQSEKLQIPTTVFLIRAIQTVLVSITHIGVVNTAMVRTQEVIRGACGDSGICQ